MPADPDPVIEQSGIGGFRRIGIAREARSPENPSENLAETDLRVAMVPAELSTLVGLGRKVHVERGAGEGIGFTAEAFEQAGAFVEDERQLFQNKDLIIKLKGPSLESIELMSPGTTILCFAHIESFPERKRLLEEHGINVLSMEEILEHPQKIHPEVAKGQAIVERLLKSMTIPPSEVEITVVGFSPLTKGIIKEACRSGASVRVVQDDARVDEMMVRGGHQVLFFDSARTSPSKSVINYMKALDATILDLTESDAAFGPGLLDDYMAAHPPKEFGKRRVEFLDATGQCGTRYGFQLLREMSPLHKEKNEASVLVCGYGNVAMGAIGECYRSGTRIVDVIGRTHMAEGAIENFLASADLIVNGVDLSPELRGKRFIISREHTANVIRPGSVVIDLVGGSKTERSAIENILTCTYLSNPYFEEHGVYFSAIWGWPMLGMMRESAEHYSRQILDILIGEERIIDGLNNLTPGVSRAFVLDSRRFAPPPANADVIPASQRLDIAEGA